MSAEAIRIPSAGAVFWAEALPDGSGGVRAISGPPPVLKVTLSTPLPNGISARAGSRGLVLLTSPILYEHIPTQIDLATLPQLAAISVRGTAEPLDGRFHPRQFALVPTPAVPSFVALRPSLQATRIGEAGAVVLNLKWQNGTAASWSVIRLTCTRNGINLGFSGQADIAGDVIIPLTGLPPLPPSQTNDVMTLTARGQPGQTGQASVDPDVQQAIQVSIGGGFAMQQTVPVPRGRISTPRRTGNRDDVARPRRSVPWIGRQCRCDFPTASLAAAAAILDTRISPFRRAAPDKRTS
jgi:hypothetical protein